MAQGLFGSYMDPGITSGILSQEDEEWVRKRLEEKKVKEKVLRNRRPGLSGAAQKEEAVPLDLSNRFDPNRILPGLAGAGRRMNPPIQPTMPSAPPPPPPGMSGMVPGQNMGQVPMPPPPAGPPQANMMAGPGAPPGPMPMQGPPPPQIPPNAGLTGLPPLPGGQPPQKKGLMDFLKDPKMAQSLLMAGASRPGRRFDIPYGPGESTGPMVKAGLLNYQKLDKAEKAGRATTATALLAQKNKNRDYQLKVEKEKRLASESGKAGAKWRKEVKSAYTSRRGAVTTLDRLMKGEDATLTEEMLGENASPMMLTISKMLSGGKPDPATRERAIDMLNTELAWLNKTYDLDLAEQIYEEAGGDKELAKKIARERGLNF